MRAEVWRNREAYAQRHQHDLARIVLDQQERQRRSLSNVVDRRPQTRRPVDIGHH